MTGCAAICASAATRRTRSTPSCRPPPRRIDLVPARLAAVQSFVALPEAEALAAANKRIVNILKKSGATLRAAIDRARSPTAPSTTCSLAFQKLLPSCANTSIGATTPGHCSRWPARARVDRFFDDVMVMADDPALRANRLALLRGVAHDDEPRRRHLEAGRLTERPWSNSPPNRLRRRARSS